MKVEKDYKKMLKQILIVTCGIVGGFAFPTSAGAFDQNNFELQVARTKSLSDLKLSWRVRPPFHYDVFNVRVEGGPLVGTGPFAHWTIESQKEVPGGAQGSFTQRNAEVGLTYTFKVQGCDKKTFESKCTPWSQIRFKNILGNNLVKEPAAPPPAPPPAPLSPPRANKP
jgi:hypothetical protein